MKLEEFIAGEFIGLELKVISSPNPSLIGIQGRVVDETMNLLIVLSGSELKRIPKPRNFFEFKLESGERIQVPGDLIRYRPEDRIEKSPRRLRMNKGYWIRKMVR